MVKPLAVSPFLADLQAELVAAVRAAETDLHDAAEALEDGSEESWRAASTDIKAIASSLLAVQRRLAAMTGRAR